MNILFEGADENGDSNIADFEPQTSMDYRGQLFERTIHMSGDFDGATVTFYALPHGVEDNWTPLPDYVFTEPNAKNIRIRAFKLKGVITGAGAATEINGYLD